MTARSLEVIGTAIGVACLVAVWFVVAEVRYRRQRRRELMFAARRPRYVITSETPDPVDDPPTSSDGGSVEGGQ